MNRRFFITGTDTGVGKTVVTAALTLALRARGENAMSVKPVQTGAVNGDDDATWCEGWYDPAPTAAQHADLTMVRLPLPTSPHLAASEAGQRVTIQSLENRVERLSKDWNPLVIEGAGGLLVPLNETETMLDLIKALRATPVVVARDNLGTLNHTQLTLRALAAEGLIPAAVVLAASTPPRDATDQLIRADNLIELTRRIAPVPVIAFPYLGAMSRASLLAAGAPVAAAVG